MQPVRVLMVDDSPTMRRFIRLALSSDPRIDVVGEAGDAFEARDKIQALRPDVLTLDVEMPGMTGLQFLEKLMRLRPMPVIMVSSETHRGSTAAIEALALGAVDCIGKPGAVMNSQAFSMLPDLVVAASQANLRPSPAPRRALARPAAPSGTFAWNGSYVLIGSSTGGVEALEQILDHYPENCPPTLITQHMPAGFLASFAQRLNQRFAPKIVLASEGAPLRQGHVYIAPGGDTHLELAAGVAPKCRLVESPRRSGHRPSVDVLFESATPLARKALAVILTGMGRDGADGMLALRKAGARCFAQDEASSVVFGMPRVALEIGAAEAALPLSDIGTQILRLSGGGSQRRAAGA